LTSGIRGPADFWAGLIYIAFGVTAIVVAQDYGMGSALRMGPGYFPAVLGTLLTLIGILGLVRGLRVQGDAVVRPSIRSICLIAGPIILFGMLLRSAGLLIAMPILIFGSAYASSYFSLFRTTLLTIGLTAFCSLVFVKGLGIPLPLLGSWFGN
jgi:putative tricarboxylic transport membrane protein